MTNFEKDQLGLKNHLFLKFCVSISIEGPIHSSMAI